MENNSTQNIYEKHHQNSRESGFSILEKERGILLKEIIGENKKVLDIGCRDGALTKYFSEKNDVTGVDIDNLSLAKAAKNLGIKTSFVDLNGDWRELKEEKFDFVVAGEILEHLYHPEKIIQQVIKYLDQGGLFLGSVPNAFSLKNRLRYLKGSKRFTPLSDPTHINHFSYNELKKIFEKYFLQVEIIGLGRYSWLAKKFPNFFAFDLFFKVSSFQNEKNISSN
ncbi:class I SAM-dependent methyltransferase [Candidatus Nomurabacteria bacterium]|nr:class I SAM-dependent methyltransferase [Candidatus Nomurabacteria bacterium]